MMRSIYQYFTKSPPIPSAYIDGFLYVSLAFWTACNTAMGSDEAEKWIPPCALFWVKTVCGVNSAWLLALKMFRSTSFSDHKEEKKKENDTQFTNKV